MRFKGKIHSVYHESVTVVALVNGISQIEVGPELECQLEFYFCFLTSSPHPERPTQADIGQMQVGLFSFVLYYITLYTEYYYCHKVPLLVEHVFHPGFNCMCFNPLWYAL